MKHLPTTVLQHIFTACAPTAFPESPWDDGSRDASSLPPLPNRVNFMLHTNHDAKLPCDTWPDCRFWSGVVDAAVMRYKDVGSRAPGVALRNIMGFWKVSEADPKCMTWTVFPSAPVNQLPWALDPGMYRLIDALSWDCTVTLSLSGATFKLADQLGDTTQIPETSRPWPAPSSPPLPGAASGSAVATISGGAVGDGAGQQAPPQPVGAASVAGSNSSTNVLAPAALCTPTKGSAAAPASQ